METLTHEHPNLSLSTCSASRLISSSKDATSRAKGFASREMSASPKGDADTAAFENVNEIIYQTSLVFWNLSSYVCVAVECFRLHKRPT